MTGENEHGVGGGKEVYLYHPSATWWLEIKPSSPSSEAED